MREEGGGVSKKTFSIDVFTAQNIETEIVLPNLRGVLINIS